MRHACAWALVGVLGCGGAAQPPGSTGLDAGMDADAHDAGPHDGGPPVDAYAEDVGALTLADGAPCGGALELGRCGLVDGGICTGTPGEPSVFVPMRAGDAVPAVVGPQAATMLVLAARTRGIAPGDPSMPASRANPTVEIRAVDGAGSEVALYRGRTTFAIDPSDATLLVQPSFFVVVDGAASSLSSALTAHATLSDATGATRCGSLTFMPTR